MRTPAIVLNFKAYDEVVGERGMKLARLCDELAKDEQVSIVLAPQLVDLALICNSVSIPVFAQHVDAITPGSRTGQTTPEALRGAGAHGTLLNHSERRMRLANIEFAVRRCSALGLETIVCANNIEVSKASALLMPTFVAIEPPELIGGDVSVTTADPDIVANTVAEIKRINPHVRVLCGAGVKTSKDVAKALELGAEGVLLASGVVKATDSRAVLLDLVSGLG